ncbi:hypothetical protein P3L10_006288 [Capsicum annuum]
MNMIKDILEERKSSTGKGKKEDFLDDILGEVVGKKIHSAVSSAEYKSTTFAHKVVNEIVRLSNIVPGIFRKVVNDVKIEGFTIPAGWIVLVCPPSVHLDSNNYEDPHVFNPWRWKAKWTCGNPQVHPTSSWRLVGVSDYVLELISPSCKYHFFSPLLGH